MKNFSKKDIFFLLVFLFFWIVFFKNFFFQGLVPIPGNLLVSRFFPWREEQWPQYPGGVYKQGLFGFDTVRQIYPWRRFSTDQLVKGEWPLWNPYQFSGAPHLANFQTAIFYPLNLIYLVMPQVWAWTFLFILQSLLAGIFMYLLARKLQVSPLGSFFASFSYAFSLTMSVWLTWNIHGHQFMYLPLILCLIENYKKKDKFKNLLALVVTLTLTFLAGHPQIFIFIFIFAGIYFFCRTKRIKAWLLVGLVVIGLTAIAWIPLAEYYCLASREIPSSEFDYEKTLLPWQNLITLTTPDFFGNPTTDNYWGKGDYTERSFSAGMTALIFGLIACFNRNARKKSKFFIFTFLTVLALTLDWFLPRIPLWLKVPIITSSPATRILFLATFSLSLLAGFGLDVFLANKKFPKIYLILGLVLIFLYIWLFVAPKIYPYRTWFEYLRVMKRNLVLPFVVFIVTGIILFLVVKIKKFKKKFIYLLLPFMALDLFYVANKVVPFTYKELVFPQHPLIEFLQQNSQFYRFTSLLGSNLESNFATFLNIYSPEGYDTLYPRWYGELVWAGSSGQYRQDISRTTVVMPSNQSDYHHRLEDLLGVAFVFTNKKSLENLDWNKNFPQYLEKRYELFWKKDNLFVFKNKEVLPRVFLADKFLIIKKPKEIIEKIYNKDFNPRQTIILEEQPSEVFKVSSDGGKAEIVRYEPSKVVVKTEAKGTKLLFLSDTFYPGWEVFVDGNKGKIYKADYAFRTVFVPKGEHEVVFSYQPMSFKIGLVISIISFGGIIVYILKRSDLAKRKLRP